MIIDVYKYSDIHRTIFVSVRFTAYCWLNINAEELQEIASRDEDVAMHFENVINPDV